MYVILHGQFMDYNYFLIPGKQSVCKNHELSHQYK